MPIEVFFNQHLSKEQISMSVALAALSRFGTNDAPNVKNLDEKDPEQAELKRIGIKCEAIFTKGVDYLENTFPNPRINKLMRVVWDLCGNKVTPVGVGPDIPTIAVAAMKISGKLQSVVICPKNWPEQFANDPTLQTGALVMIGSQIVDYYNNKMDASDPIKAKECHKSLMIRARIWEAEYLKTVMQHGALKPNQYQLDLLGEYPLGIDSAPAGYIYESRQYKK